MKVSQLLKPNVVDTTVFNQLPPKHKEVVNDFYNQVEKSDGNIIDRVETTICLLYTSPSPRDQRGSRMPSSA